MSRRPPSRKAVWLLRLESVSASCLAALGGGGQRLTAPHATTDAAR